MAQKRNVKAKTKKQNDNAKGESKQGTAVILFGVAIVLMALVIFRLDSLWALLHDYLLGLFGWTAFIIPIYVGYVAWMLSKGIQSKGKAIIIQTAITVFLMGALTNAVIFDGDVSSVGLTDYTLGAYERGAAGGGWFAAFLSWLITLALTKAGSIIVFIVAIAVMLMLITKFTVDKLINKVSKPVKRLGQEVKEACEGIKRYGEEEQTPVHKRRTAKDDEEFVPDIDVPLDDEEHQSRRERQKRSRREELERKRNKLHETYQQGMSANEPHPLDIPLNTDDPDEYQDVTEEPVLEAPVGVTRVQEPVTQPVKTEEKPQEIKQEEKPKSSIVVEAETQYNYPPISLLEKATAGESMGEIDLKVNADKLVETLSSFGVQTKVVDISRGPSVTRYELQPAPGVRVSKITGLADDIALNLAANGVRIEAPIPGKAAVGIELPNKNKSIVKLREIVESKDFLLAKSKLTFAVGKDLAGKCITADIDKMPHLLIAGATGSGKSVCINALITSLLFKASPDEVKFVMIDPKQIELAAYNGIPHLLVPVVTDVRKAAGALNWAVNEMQKRYNLFGEVGAKKLSEYNRMAHETGEFNPLPQIVIIIDELAELMMVAPRDVEDYICRLAQLARAAGMHLVIATQRPSVDVITGLIKANVPSRIAFAVANQFDSRTIIDQSGAEKLLGYGDMLFYPVGANKPVRVQGCYASDDEINSVIKFIKDNANADYNEDVQSEIEKLAVKEKKGASTDSSEPAEVSGDDDLVIAAAGVVIEAGIASTSLLQRKLKLGYARAARIIDELEERGIIGPFEGSKPRKVLMSRETWLEMKNQQQ